ncbi:MAG: hypothetical protein DMG51_15590 [Acidobacteria bacterium]|nr:MAG: hypothetical protein DMG51_15590 [Acidobacteriota bacterium]
MFGSLFYAHQTIRLGQKAQPSCRGTSFRAREHCPRTLPNSAGGPGSGHRLRHRKTLAASCCAEAARRLPNGLELTQADLERTHLPERRFDLILCIQYLQRSLFSQMARALRPDGVLLFETYTRAQLEFAGGPRNPAYLLETGELREAFPELCVQFYRELRAGQGIASMVARKRDEQG